MLLVWPRFLMVVFFVTMLFAYHALAWIEERECLRKYGQAYTDYQQRTPRFLPFRLPFRLQLPGRPSARPWPVRLATGALAYATALALALLLAFASQAYTLRHLIAYAAGDAVYLALTPLDAATLQRVAQAAAADRRVRLRLAPVTGQGARLINYVMPWEWAVTEIPMNGVRSHHTPDDYDRGKYKIVYTRAVLPTDATAQGLDILRSAARTEPVGEAWIDDEGRVARVLEPPNEIFYGTVPVPVF
jgi:hypothetical protein